MVFGKVSTASEMQRLKQIATLTKGLLAGDRATLARSITLVESRSPKWQSVGQELVSASVEKGKKLTEGEGGEGNTTFQCHY